MATTSLWRVKGQISKVVNYAVDASKTEQAEDLSQVIGYAMQQGKTAQPESETVRQFVTGINCHASTAVAEMTAVKKRFGKEDGTIAYHGYQSFAPGEGTPELVHEIGIKLAQRLWGERYQVVVATHLDKANHLHSHFVLNTVSFADGKKFHRTKADYYEMQKVSDALCQEYGLSVVERSGGRAKHYSEWQAEQNGKPTYRGTIRADIDRAVLASTTEREFIRVMQAMGYEFKTRGKSGRPLKYPALKPPDSKGYFRFHKLGQGYSLEEVKERILRNIRKQLLFPEADRWPNRHYQPRRKITGLRALYFRYCYELHIIVKHPASVKRVSFLLREDVIKLDRLDAQTRFLGKHKISTMEELMEYRSNTSDRREVVLCDEIALRSSRVIENLERLMKQKEIEREEAKQDELRRGRGRTSRAHELRDG